MKKSIFLLLVLLLTGCATFQVSTLNHDPIYSIEGSDAEIVVINNEFELQRLLRTDFKFRFDFAQYALSQPRSFDWNNRILGTRYNRYNPYYGFGYSPYWNRTQMWNDWAWGITPHRWSPFGYDRWGYNNYGWNNYGWNNYGWNNYYGWNNGFYNRYRGTNVSYHTGRRSSIRTTTNRRVVNNNNRVVTTPRTRTVVKNKPRVIKNKPRIIKNKPRVVINNKPRINNPRPRFNTPPRQPSTIRTTPRTSTRSNNTRTVRSNSRRKN